LIYTALIVTINLVGT